MGCFVLAWLLCQSTEKPPPLSADARQALAVASQLEAGRAFAAAREQLRAVLPHVDAAYRDDLSLRACMLWSREGRAPEARRCLAATRLAGRPQQALALYHQGALSEELLEPVLAREQLHDVVRQFPETHGAERAIVLLRSLRNAEAGEQAEADLLLSVASELAVVAPEAKRLLAGALCEGARLLLALGKAAAAGQVYAEARSVATQTVWADDALYGSARTARALGEHEAAIRFYTTLIDAREASWVVGSYDSQYLDESYLELADALRVTGRRREAAAVLATMVSTLPASRLRQQAEAARRALLTP